MNNLLELVIFIFMLFGFLIIFGVMMAAIILVADYQRYQDLNHEGYKVKFDWGCYIYIKNIDGSKEWRQCVNLGNNFVLENYGVKK